MTNHPFSEFMMLSPEIQTHTYKLVSCIFGNQIACAYAQDPFYASVFTVILYLTNRDVLIFSCLFCCHDAFHFVSSCFVGTQKNYYSTALQSVVPETASILQGMKTAE